MKPARNRILSEEKTELHPRNRHRSRYNFAALIAANPELEPFVKPNRHGVISINFFDPEAVKALNRVLLRTYYGIQFWDIPPGYLCPPVPGRADYIHYAADLLAADHNGEIPSGKKIHCLDTGTGANCIYPIIGNAEYAWSFTGSDIDSAALKTARAICDFNPSLKEKVSLRLQTNPQQIFRGIIQPSDFFHLTICNPPFHASRTEAEAGTRRKLNSLTGKKHDTVQLNFGGQSNELWCEGGEAAFLHRMIGESREFGRQVVWFTSLVSKQSNLKAAGQAIEKAEAVECRTIEMGQGNKISRILAWTFMEGSDRRDKLLF